MEGNERAKAEAMNPGMSADQILSLVKEKIQEKNEVIKEQQIQIQELQEKCGALEEENNKLKIAAREHEDLVKKISEILD